MHRLRTDDEELQCVAVGHDLLEDTDTTEAELEALGFSQRVISAIQCLTKHEGMTEDFYRSAVKSNPDAVRVKIEDLRHNSDIRRLKGISPKDIERIVRYQEFYLELRSLSSQDPRRDDCED
jgi:(p)ppGpp synthase/HD superfamily hydrolase